MKRRILALFLAATVFILSACAPMRAVVGTWTLTEKTTAGVPDDLSDLSVQYTFQKNGTFNMVVNGMDAAEGTYTFEENLLTWTVDNNSGYMVMIDDKLVHETTVNNDLMISVYEKN